MASIRIVNFHVCIQVAQWPPTARLAHTVLLLDFNRQIRHTVDVHMHLHKMFFLELTHVATLLNKECL